MCPTRGDLTLVRLMVIPQFLPSRVLARRCAFVVLHPEAGNPLARRIRFQRSSESRGTSCYDAWPIQDSWVEDHKLGGVALVLRTRPLTKTHVQPLHQIQPTQAPSGPVLLLKIHLGLLPHHR